MLPSLACGKITFVNKFIMGTVIIAKIDPLINDFHKCGCPKRPAANRRGTRTMPPNVLHVFEHKTQCMLIHAPHTRIMVFWHISNIPPKDFTDSNLLWCPHICEILLYSGQLVVLNYVLISVVRLLTARGKIIGKKVYCHKLKIWSCTIFPACASICCEIICKNAFFNSPITFSRKSRLHRCT